MKSAFLLVLGACLAAGGEARIVYTKSFPGSTPAFVSITVEPSGKAEFREAPDEENPLKFELEAAEVKEIFDLAERLGRFTRPLEAELKVKVANMGIKTFRFEDGATRHEVKFNYTIEPDARALADWFERITETELHLIALERTARFDKLGVYQTLLQLEAAWDRKRIVAPRQFLAMLERIQRNESYVRVARDRAAALAEAFRAASGGKAGE